MTYQLIYSSESTTPMQLDDLEELLAQARSNNAAKGLTGALIYAERIFLQVLEGDRSTVEALMGTIRKDLRHEKVTILQQSEIPSPLFGTWKMAFVSATREQVANWAGIGVATGAADPPDDDGPELRRTSRFAQEILALLAPEENDKAGNA